MSVWIWKHSQGMSRSLLVALSYQRHMTRCFYEWIVIILFIKDFILNLSRSQLFLQSSLIEEHPIQQAFIVLMFPSLLFGQQKAAIKSLNGWLALLCSRSLCLGCDVMHTWWANKQKTTGTLLIPTFPSSKLTLHPTESIAGPQKVPSLWIWDYFLHLEL